MSMCPRVTVMEAVRRTRKLDKLAAVSNNGKLDPVDEDLVSRSCVGCSGHLRGAARPLQVVEESGTFFIFLLLKLLQTGLFDGLDASFSLLLINAGIDQLQVAISLGNP